MLKTLSAHSVQDSQVCPLGGHVRQATQKTNCRRKAKSYLSLLCCRTLIRGLGIIKLIVTENLGDRQTPLAELRSKRRLSSSAASFRSGQQAISLYLTQRTPESPCYPIILWPIYTCSVFCTRGRVGVLFTVPLWSQSLSGSLLLHSHTGLW